MKAMITMKQTTKFEVVSDDKMREMEQENDSKRFKLESVQLPTPELKDAERALERVPVTNKLYTRLQKQLEQAKKKKLQKEEQERIARKLAQMEANINITKSIDDSLDL